MVENLELLDEVRTEAPLLTAFSIVAVGASDGGLDAFVELLRYIPADTGLGFVVLQHLDASRESHLKEMLSRATRMPVLEAAQGMRIEPNHVYVMPSNADVGLASGTLSLRSRTGDRTSPHLPIDAFFADLAADRGAQAIGVVLTGQGKDGVEGVRAIKAVGGLTLVQKPNTAKAVGMPEAVIGTGLADFVLPLQGLAKELVRIAQHPLAAYDAKDTGDREKDAAHIARILQLLEPVVGVDFGEYKEATLRRRLGRRMLLARADTLDDYVAFLHSHPTELGLLFEDLLIHVTSFFRDPEVFESLAQTVFPSLLAKNRRNDPIRIWCAGCSTGEEAYSIVIALLEFLDQNNVSGVSVRLFGSDISEAAIAKARIGTFSEEALRGVSPARLARYFSKDDRYGYRINKNVRERCAFVKHNLASDPPYSKLDLVSCRNVLIYFTPELQKRVVATFQFALKQPGFLLLGRSENVGDPCVLFAPVDKENRVFERTNAKNTLRLPYAKEAQAQPVPKAAAKPETPVPEDFERQVETALLQHYVPPGVVVNEALQIVHFRGQTGRFLEPAPGQPHHNLLHMARKGLVVDLRVALHLARTKNITIKRLGVKFDFNERSNVCDLVIIPLPPTPAAEGRLFAVLFDEDPEGTTIGQPRASQDTANLETMLEATQNNLQNVIAENKKANEELTASNEELVSGNEELQTLNEELETAKEELQSANEELSTLNQELETRNTEINAANGDLINVLGSVDVPIVIVDAARNIRRFTPKAKGILNLIPGDIGRPIDHIKPTLNIRDLDQKIAEVIASGGLYEEQAQGNDGRWHRLQIRAFRSDDHQVDGAVLSVVDIDTLKRQVGEAEWARDYARATVQAVQTPLVLLDERLTILSLNEAFRVAYGVSTDCEGQMFHEIMVGALNLPELHTGLQHVLDDPTKDFALQRDCIFPKAGVRTISFSGRSVANPSGQKVVLLAMEDVTDRLHGEAERSSLLASTEAAKASAENANRAKDVFLATLSHELRTPLSTLLMQAQLLRRGAMDEVRLARASGVIERAAKSQARLIDDLLDISRIVTGKLKVELQPISLAAVVRSAYETLAPVAAKKSLRVDLVLNDQLRAISGDAARMQQVVLNLFTNAIKFTPTDGSIVITVAQVDGACELRITDSGVGIEAAFLPRIFDRFSQEKGRQSLAYEGLGLGLAIVRHIVEVHGGTLSAQSEGKDRGSTFVLRFPFIEPVGESTPNAPLQEANSAPAASLSGVRILVVEDDGGMRESLSDLLAMRGPSCAQLIQPRKPCCCCNRLSPIC